MDNLLERVDALERHLQTVERRLRWWRRLAWGLVVLSLVSLGQSSSSAQEERTSEGRRSLVQRLDDVEDVLQKLKQFLTHVTIAEDEEGRLEIVITGANLRLVNGLGRTDCGDDPDNPLPDCPNGLGNLIVGYNESREPDFGPDVRTGSHNVVVGRQHNFSRFGGIVVGDFNTISGDFAAVSGGISNTARGVVSSISGGRSNEASGFFATISGGEANTASADDPFDDIGGGASVSGGKNNTASGDFASVSGGRNRTAEGEFDWVAGSLFEEE